MIKKRLIRRAEDEPSVQRLLAENGDDNKVFDALLEAGIITLFDYKGSPQEAAAYRCFGLRLIKGDDTGVEEWARFLVSQGYSEAEARETAEDDLITGDTRGFTITAFKRSDGTYGMLGDDNTAPCDELYAEVHPSGDEIIKFAEVAMRTDPEAFVREFNDYLQLVR